MKFIITLACVFSMFGTTQVHSSPANNNSIQVQTLSEQKAIVADCRLIRSYAFNQYCGLYSSGSSAYLQAVVPMTEEYLRQVNSSISYAMLCDLQKLGQHNYQKWCQKYGI